jgi:hypothetical protein
MEVKQTIGRCWRHGQTETVHVYFVLAPGTVDEILSAIANGKLLMMTHFTEMKTIAMKLFQPSGDASDDEEDEARPTAPRVKSRAPRRALKQQSVIDNVATSHDDGEVEPQPGATTKQAPVAKRGNRPKNRTASKQPELDVHASHSLAESPSSIIADTAVKTRPRPKPKRRLSNDTSEVWLAIPSVASSFPAAPPDSTVTSDKPLTAIVPTDVPPTVSLVLEATNTDDRAAVTTELAGHHGPSVDAAARDRDTPAMSLLPTPPSNDHPVTTVTVQHSTTSKSPNIVTPPAVETPLLPLHVDITPDGGIDMNGNSDVDNAALVTYAFNANAESSSPLIDGMTAPSEKALGKRKAIVDDDVMSPTDMRLDSEYSVVSSEYTYLSMVISV